MISMKQIASVCNVSEAVVSKALGNRAGVSEKTRRRVHDVARQFNYRPNALVRSLQSGKTMTVAVACNVLDDPYVGQVMQGILEALYQKSYEAIVFNWDLGVRDNAHMVRSMGERRVEGLLMFPPARVPTPEYLAELRAFPGHIVQIDQQWSNSEFDFVGTDDRAGSVEATEHLISLGHRRIACMHYREVSTGLERYEGFAEAMIRHGVPMSEELIVAGGCDFEQGYQQAKTLLSLPDRPTAVVCFNDVTAMALIAAAHDMNIRVPQDLSVTGFADLPMAQQVRPRLTTVQQMPRELGKKATELLLVRLAEEEKTMHAAPKIIRTPTSLIIRDSTMPIHREK